MKKCPDKKTLSDFQSGSMPVDRRAELETHIDMCETCQESLREKTIVDASIIDAAEEPGETVTFGPKTLGDADVTVTQVPGSARQSVIGIPQQVAGYDISGKLGHGGMGTVWRAVQRSTKREVALKLMNAKSFQSESGRFRFQREVELAAMLDHPNIARIYEAGVDGETHYYAMQLVNGKTLERFVKANKPSHREIIQLMLPVCRAVEAAHRRGVIHRDIKPSNVVVSAEGQPFVLDFGLAKSLEEEPTDAMATRQGQTPGTPAYMAPEQARGEISKVDTRSDVYALGVMLFRLLTGTTPHDVSGTTFDILRRIVDEDVKRPRDVNPQVDPDVEAILLKALAKQQAARYGSAGGLANDLERYLNGDPLEARPATAMYFLSKRLKKHRVPIGIASAILLGLISLVAYGYVRERDLRTKADAARIDAVDKGGKAIAAAERARQAETMATAEAKRATEAEARARSEAEAARRQLYFNRIALANQYAQTGRWWEANELLDLCPDDLRHWEWGFLKQQSNRLITTCAVPAGPVSYAFSADGETLFIGTWSSSLVALDAKTGKQLWHSNVHNEGRVLALMLSDHGRIATLGRDQLLKVWQLPESSAGQQSKSATAESIELALIAQFPANVGAGYPQTKRCALSADGTRVATTDKAVVLVSDVDSGDELFRCVGHSGIIEDVTFNRTDGTIATVAQDGSARIWDSSGKPRHVLSVRTDESHPKLDFTEDGSKLIVASRNLNIFDVQSGELLESTRPGMYRGLGISSSGDRVVLREFGHLTSVVSPETRQTLYRCISAANYGFAISRDGRKFAHPIEYGSQTIQIVDVSLDTKSRQLNSRISAVSPRADVLATARDSGRILLKTSKGQWLRTLKTDEGQVSKMHFTGDGNILAARVDDRTVLWEVKSGARFDVPGTEKLRLATVAVGSNTYAVTTQGKLAVWEHRSDELLDELEKREWRSIIVSNGPCMLALLLDDQHIEIWDRTTGKRLHELDHGYTQDFALSPNDRLLAASNFDSRCSMFDLATGKVLYYVHNVQGPFAFSPDNSRLLAFRDHSKERTNTLRLLDTESGDEILMWEGVDRGTLQFTSDGGQLVASSGQTKSLFGDPLERWHEGTQHDLVPYIHPARDVVAGRWERAEDGLTCQKDPKSRIRVPVQPLGDYRLTIKFKRTSEPESFGIFLPVRHKLALLLIDGWPYHGGYTGLNGLNGSEVIEQPDAVRGIKLAKGVEHQLTIEVTSASVNASIQASLNGKKLFAWNGPHEHLHVAGQYDISGTVLGLYSHEIEAEIESMKLELLKGDAYLRFDPAREPIAIGAEIDVLPHIIPDRDLERGEWNREGTDLISGNTDRNILLAPIEVNGSYEWSVDFTPQETTESFNLLLPTPTSVVAAEWNSFLDRHAGLSFVDGKGANENETNVQTAPIEVGKRYQYTARVYRLDGKQVKIEGELNDEPLFTWTGDDNRLRYLRGVTLPARPGIACYKTKYRVTGMTFHLLDGEATLLAPLD